MPKQLKSFGLVLIIGLLLFAFVGCSDSKTLAEDQYQISRHGNTFTVTVTDTDPSAKNIESIKLKIRYKYTVIEYENGSIYATDITNKSKTETFEVKKSGNSFGRFVGSFTVTEDVFEYECKKAVAYYADPSQSSDDDEQDPSPSDGVRVGILEAIGLSLIFCIICVVVWFILGLFLDVNLAFYIACVPGVIAFLGMLVTGQWIPALIFLLGLGAALSIAQVIYNKIGS